MAPPPPARPRAILVLQDSGHVHVGAPMAIGARHTQERAKGTLVDALCRGRELGALKKKRKWFDLISGS